MRGINTIAKDMQSSFSFNGKKTFQNYSNFESAVCQWNTFFIHSLHKLFALELIPRPFLSIKTF